ncbi:MAG: relaxase/mobilization nuclease domain-containing protein [Candidatus Thiodiazotropha sp.]
MILKASKRGGAKQLARHLMNGEKNEHVTVHEVSGFAGETVSEALNEIYAISQGTKCSRFMFSLSLNPPQDKQVPVAAFEDALAKIEQKLGMENQPRIIVFHEKKGRRHAHCVWSRINEEMRAIDLPFFKNKLKDVSKEIYIQHGWKLPAGLIDKSQKNPLNFTRAEWQQAARTGRNPKAIKAALQESWATSDNRTSFEHALAERGFYLAKGDRRGFVAIDIFGEVYALPRQLGIKKKDVERRLGNANALPSVETVKENISGEVSKVSKKFLGELNKDHQKALQPLQKTKAAMTRQHRLDRKRQKAFQAERWTREENKRAARVRKGLKGIWDKLSGRYWKTRKQNEKETFACLQRDQREHDDLIRKQLEMRQNLQVQIKLLNEKQEEERSDLIRDLSRMKTLTKKKRQRPAHSKQKRRQQSHDIGFEPSGPDIEPEI